MMDFIADDIGLVNSSEVVTYVTMIGSGSQTIQDDSPNPENEKTSENPDSNLKLGIYSDEKDLLTLNCHRQKSSDQVVTTEKESTPNRMRNTAQVQSTLARKVQNKKLPNSDIFSGLIDIITGLPLRGQLCNEKTGDVYDGPFYQGIRHGDGAVLTKGDGTKFLGSFKNDQPSEGTLITSEFTYNGQLLVTPITEQSTDAGNKPYIFHGTDATLMQRNGHVYEGDFSHGRYHGVGQERTPCGLIYRGQFRAGKWHGNGELTYEKRNQDAYRKASSKKARLSAVDEKPNGEVCNVERTRRRYPKFNPNSFRYTYSGKWEHGEREGRGFEKIIFAIPFDQAGEQRRSNQFTSLNVEERTATFSGEFHRDQRYGCGSLTLPEGTVLVGNWKKGLPVTMARGEVDDFAEKSVKNELVGNRKMPKRGSYTNLLSSTGNRKSHKKRSRPGWKIEFNNGNFYQGECAYMSSSADGMKMYMDRDPMRSHLRINSSMFLCIVPHGHGTMTYSSRDSTSCDIYVGNFRLGKRHGYGRIAYNKTNEEYDGTWIDDIPGEVGGQQLHVHQPQFDHSVNDGDKDNSNIVSSCHDDNSLRSVPQLPQGSEAVEKVDKFHGIKIMRSHFKKQGTDEGENEEENRQLEQAVEALINCGSSASSASSSTPKRSSTQCSTDCQNIYSSTSVKVDHKAENLKRHENKQRHQYMHKQSRQKSRRGDNTPSTATLSHQGDDDDGSITIMAELNALNLQKVSNPVKQSEVMESEETVEVCLA
jgi:hypothetical protein